MPREGGDGAPLGQPRPKAGAVHNTALAVTLMRQLPTLEGPFLSLAVTRLRSLRERAPDDYREAMLICYPDAEMDAEPWQARPADDAAEAEIAAE